MNNENYIRYLEKVALAALERWHDFEEMKSDTANPDDSPGYFIPYNVREHIQQQRKQRQDCVESSKIDARAKFDINTVQPKRTLKTQKMTLSERIAKFLQSFQ